MRFSLLISSLCLGLTSNTYAQQNTNGTELGLILVESNAIKDQAYNAAKAQSIVDAGDILKQQPISIAESLENTVGVGIENSNKPLMGNISVRGFTNERINLSVDNMEVEQYSDGLSSSSKISALTFSPSLVKQVIIDKGGDGVDFGDGAIGGAVKIETKNAKDYLKEGQTAGAAVDLSTDSANHGGRLGLTAYGIWGNLDALGNISKARYGDVNTGEEVDTKNRTDAIDGRIKVNWNSNNGITFGSVTAYSDTKASEIPFRNQSRWIGQPLEESERMKRFQQGFNLSVEKGDFLNLESNLNFVSAQQSEKQRGKVVFRGRDYLFNTDNDFKDRKITFDIANTFHHQIGKNSASLKAKLSYDHLKFEQDNYDYDANRGGTYYGKSTGKNYALSLQEKINFGEKLTTDLGVRYDSYTRSSSKYSEFGENKDSAFSFNAGISANPTDWLMVYARYNEGYRAPNLRELYKEDRWSCHWPRKICFNQPQPNLKPERSKNIEVGFGLNFDDVSFADNFRLKTSFFHNNITDYLASAPFMYRIVNGVKVPASPQDATHRDYSTKNIGKMRSRGAELELSLEKGKFDAELAYSRMRMDVEDNPNFYLGTVENESKPYVRAPQDSLRLSLGYNATDELRFGLTAKHRFSQKRLPENYLRLGYGSERSTTLDFSAQYKPKALGDTTIKFNINNITDRGYHLYPDDDGQSQPGRSFRLGIESRF